MATAAGSKPSSASRAGGRVNLTVNDEPRAVEPATSVAGLLTQLGFADRKGVAVALNGAVVPRASWPAQTLAEGDRVLLIRATQGG